MSRGRPAIHLAGTTGVARMSMLLVSEFAFFFLFGSSFAPKNKNFFRSPSREGPFFVWYRLGANLFVFISRLVGAFPYILGRVGAGNTPGCWEHSLGQAYQEETLLGDNRLE